MYNLRQAVQLKKNNIDSNYFFLVYGSISQLDQNDGLFFIV